MNLYELRSKIQEKIYRSRQGYNPKAQRHVSYRIGLIDSKEEIEKLIKKTKSRLTALKKSRDNLPNNDEEGKLIYRAAIYEIELVLGENR